MSSQNVPEYDDLDSYVVDDYDDSFRFPPPELNDGTANKRKKAAALGIDEEVEVAKRVRAPRVRLDETRLLSDNGIPKLRKRAADLKFKGKGHEFSDTARLLSFYQFWLDDLFPKAKFLDALSMVEKAGHKKQVVLKRMEWINEGKPNILEADEVPEGTTDALDLETDPTVPNQAPATETTEQQPHTPGGGIPDGDDIYGATPLAQARNQGSKILSSGPDDTEEPEYDDLDALVAEADATAQAHLPDQGQSKGRFNADDFADEEAAMAEMDGLW